MKAKDIERQEAIATLRKHLQPGDTVYMQLTHVSRSGLQRVWDVRVIKDNIPLRLTWSAAVATQCRYDRRFEGLRMSGSDFDVVYNIGRVLWPNGFECIGDVDGRRCPSNDHSNGDRDFTPHMHGDGGYALRCDRL